MDFIEVVSFVENSFMYVIFFHMHLRTILMKWCGHCGQLNLKQVNFSFFKSFRNHQNGEWRMETKGKGSSHPFPFNDVVNYMMNWLYNKVQWLNHIFFNVSKSTSYLRWLTSTSGSSLVTSGWAWRVKRDRSSALISSIAEILSTEQLFTDFVAFSTSLELDSDLSVTASPRAVIHFSKAWSFPV